jgi:hypothetical protein
MLLNYTSDFHSSCFHLFFCFFKPSVTQLSLRFVLVSCSIWLPSQYIFSDYSH